MILNLAIFDSNGKSRPGSVRMNLDFKEKQWSIKEDLMRTWPSIGASTSGAIELVSGNLVSIVDQPPGKPRQSIVTLNEVPATDRGIATAGTGKILAAQEAIFNGGGIFWGFERSSIRQAMVMLLEKHVPLKEMSSDTDQFKTLTGYDTARLKSAFWENKENPNKTFTTCNLFLGVMAGKLGALVGKTPGPKLSAGVLELIQADRDVPGSWVEPKDGNAPREGDFYSVPYKSKEGWIQKFGHVGIIGKIENGTWTSVDGGQGGYSSGRDYIKWVYRGRFEPGKFNGWIDIDKYFGS